MPFSVGAAGISLVGIVFRLPFPLAGRGIFGCGPIYDEISIPPPQLAPFTVVLL